MAYLVKLLVNTGDDKGPEERVKAALEEAGGAIRHSESTRTSSGARELYLSFVIGETQALPRIMRAVEAVSGAAVMAVTGPRELRDLKRV